MQIYVIDRNKKILKQFDYLRTTNFEKIIEIAEQLQLKCASYLDFVGDTFFNQKQMVTLKNDMKKLTSFPEIDRKDIAIILQAIEFAEQNKSHYLMFYGE